MPCVKVWRVFTEVSEMSDRAAVLPSLIVSKPIFIATDTKCPRYTRITKKLSSYTKLFYLLNISEITYSEEF